MLTERLGLTQLVWLDTRITTLLEEHDSKSDTERRQRHRWWDWIKDHGTTNLKTKIRIELLLENPPTVDQEPRTIVMGGIKSDVGTRRRCGAELLSETRR